MYATDSSESVAVGFEALKKRMKAAGLAALEAEDFGRSREVMSLMEELVALERRTQGVLGDEVQTSEVDEQRVLLPDGYPRFFRRDSLLVKEGLRRDGESTYEQKLPREIYEEILAAFRALKQTREEFHAPDVINRVRCPDYQVYIVLNLLLEAGFLDSPQRGLYRFRRRSEANWAEWVWDYVPSESSIMRKK